MKINRIKQSGIIAFIFITGFLFLSASAETLQPAEWLSVVRQEADNFSPEEGLRSILNGGAIYCNNYYNGDNVMKFPLTTSEKKDVTLFEAFMTGEDGQEILRKILAGEALSEEELPYRYLAEAVIVSSEKRGRRKGKGRPFVELDLDLAKQHSARTKAKAEAVLKKGFSGEPWTREELEAVRLYAVSRDIYGYGNYYMPYTLGLWRDPAGNSFSYNPASLQPGKPAPDIAILRADAVWSRPGFSDRNPYHYISVISPHILIEPLLNQVGYEQVDGQLVAKPEYELEGAEAKDIFRLSDFKGKKPVLLVFSGPCDSFSWHGKLTATISHFRQVYGDQVEIAVIAVTVHDSHMPDYDYYRPEAEGPVKGIHAHPLSLEERAREAKAHIMTKPEISFPWYLDNSAQHVRNAYYETGGGAGAVLVNKDGTVGFLDRRVQYIDRIKQTYSKQNRKLPYVLYLRANVLEQAIRAAMANNGQVPEGFEPQLTPDAPVLSGNAEMLLTGEVLSATETRVTLRAKLPIDDLTGYHLWKTETGTRRHDPGRGRDLVIERVIEWVEEDNGCPELEFSIQPDTRVTLNGLAAGIEDLQPGDTVGVLFSGAAALDLSPLPALQLRISR